MNECLTVNCNTMTRFPYPRYSVFLFEVLLQWEDLCEVHACPCIRPFMVGVSSTPTSSPKEHGFYSRYRLSSPKTYMTSSGPLSKHFFCGLKETTTASPYTVSSSTRWTTQLTFLSGRLSRRKLVIPTDDLHGFLQSAQKNIGIVRAL
jgi:hypothetical protein